MSDLIRGLRSTAGEIRQIQVPDELTDETAETFKEILTLVDGFYFELLRIGDDTQLAKHREAQIRFRGVTSPQNDGGANFFAVLVAVRTICQFATYDFIDARAIHYMARLITRLKNNLLPGLADELDKIVQLLEEEPHTPIRLNI